MIDVFAAEVEQHQHETAHEAEEFLERVWRDADREVEFDDEWRDEQ